MKAKQYKVTLFDIKNGMRINSTNSNLVVCDACRKLNVRNHGFVFLNSTYNNIINLKDLKDYKIKDLYADLTLPLPPNMSNKDPNMWHNYMSVRGISIYDQIDDISIYLTLCGKIGIFNNVDEDYDRERRSTKGEMFIQNYINLVYNS